MKFTANFNSFRGLLQSFKEPVREVSVPISRGSLRVQVKEGGSGFSFFLRFSSFGSVNYYELEQRELLELAQALTDIAEEVYGIDNDAK